MWGPDLERVRARVGAVDHELVRDGGGWWSGDLEVDHGTDYAFLLGDDETPLPDPRSRWQPNGVHEASRALDKVAERNEDWDNDPKWNDDNAPE